MQDEPSSVTDSVPEPTNPTDTPLIDVAETRGLGSGHGDGQFRTMPGAVITCLTCHHQASAADYSADEEIRLEGVSDPADMMMVVPVSCPNCGATGQLILGYGPNASAEDADAMAVMQRH
jgi:hypothetical protein